MILNHRARSAILAVSFTLLAAIYGVAWFAPTVTADHDSGLNLMLAKALAAGHGYVRDNLPEPVPETQTAPVFPALLALFTMVSAQAQWLKLLPLGCALGWLWLTRRLLLRMGASLDSALLLVGLTAVSPAVVFLSTSLLAESLFALLVTAALLKLLEDKPLLAGGLAGLATLTLVAGAPLIATCIVVFAVRGRFRSALIFTAVAMVIVAPWFGWSLAHLTRATWLNANDRVATNIITGFPAGLPPNEKLVVVTRNLVSLFGSPIELLTGFRSIYAAGATALVAIWCIFIRRQLVPDIFVWLYGFTLLFFVWPPQRLTVAVLPLVFWIAWRAWSQLRNREAVAALVLIAAGLALWADGIRVPAVFTSGVFPETAEAGNDWHQMQRVLAFLTEKTSPGSVLLANSDAEFYVRTGRKTVRGFTPDGYRLFYTERQSTVTPDQISSAILQAQVNYVVLTPDRNQAESSSFHRAVEALERGGVLRPVEMPGVLPEYRLLHVNSAGF